MALLCIWEGNVIETSGKFLSTRLLLTDDLRTDFYTNISFVISIFLCGDGNYLKNQTSFSKVLHTDTPAT
jgi:hypothetical protein